jgi:hypothetical protein
MTQPLSYPEWVQAVADHPDNELPPEGVTFRENAVQWPPGTYDGDGWFIDSRQSYVVEEFAIAPAGTRFLHRDRTEWRTWAPRRTWQQTIGPWVERAVKQESGMTNVSLDPTFDVVVLEG